MHAGHAGLGRAVLVAMASALLAPATGCQSAPRDVLAPPRQIVAPYDTSRGEVLWAVAMIRNESGTSAVDRAALGDKLAAAAEEVQGVRCLPLNRSIAAMRSLGMTEVRTPGDARKLASALGVDGILVGTVTAWDPYVPKIGMAVALYAGPNWTWRGRESLDPRALAESPTISTPAGPRYADAPTALASEHLDAKNNQVLLDVKAFADGRQKHDSALGWRRYVASMDLFAEFAAYKLIDDLMREEWVRAGVTSGAGGTGGERRAQAAEGPPQR